MVSGVWIQCEEVFMSTWNRNLLLLLTTLIVPLQGCTISENGKNVR